MVQTRGLDCNEVVELITDYLEGALDLDTIAQVERHLAECPGCAVYVEQIRQTVATLGRLPGSSLSADAQARLLAAFRDFGGWPAGLDTHRS
jgi:anti-sigma factor RsiW